MIKVKVYATSNFFEDESLTQRLDSLNLAIARKIAEYLDNYDIHLESISISWIPITFGYNIDDLNIEITVSNEYKLNEGDYEGMIKDILHETKILCPIKDIVIGVQASIGQTHYIPGRN